MKTFALAILASAVSATEWGNPYGDYHSGFRYGRSARRASPAMPRMGGPTGPRYGPSRPSPRYGGAPKPRLGRPSPRGLYGKGYGANAANIVGDGMGDGYGHGRGFAKDDIANLEVDINDRDVEFEIEANIVDQDVERDLEIEIADRDIENELEDRRDHTIQDGALYRSGYGGYGGYGYGQGRVSHGSVRQVGLKQNLGMEQKRQDQSYSLRGGYGRVDYNDSGMLNRGYGYGSGYGGYGSGALGTNYNREKSYENLRDNIGTTKYDRAYDDDVLSARGPGKTIGYGSDYNSASRYGSSYGVGGYG